MAPDQLEGLLAGVYLNLAPVIVDAGAQYRAASEAMLRLAAGLDTDQRATMSIDLGADPLTATLSGRPAPRLTMYSRSRDGGR